MLLNLYIFYITYHNRSLGHMKCVLFVFSSKFPNNAVISTIADTGFVEFLEYEI